VRSVGKPKRFMAVWPLFLIGFALVPASAQQEQRSPTVRELLSISVNPNSDFTRPGRAKFVGALARYCHEVLAALPTNTPRDDAWVMAEMNTSDMAKINRLVSSPEYNRYILKDYFTSCEEGTQKIISIQDQASRTENLIRYEASHLVSLAAIFNNSNDIEAHAQRAGLKPQAFALDFISSVRRALLFAALRTLEGE
jgi:hypothetical protein